jgi:hypothetical protein
MEIEFHAGFEQEPVVRCVQAHLMSFAPKHENKIAGVAFMLRQMATLQSSAKI